ncbi:MAG: transporter substrate-binding domain-containing protein [Thermoleophilia bacterium]|nr:transporter substrate-binding domain-containing protein [Thermoleophilia bacterium]
MPDDLGAGVIDAALDDEVPLAAIARRTPGLAVGCTIPTGNRYVVAFSRLDTGLRDRVDDALGRLAASGELGRMFERWTGRPLPADVAGA